MGGQVGMINLGDIMGKLGGARTRPGQLPGRAPGADARLPHDSLEALLGA